MKRLLVIPMALLFLVFAGIAQAADSGIDFESRSQDIIKEYADQINVVGEQIRQFKENDLLPQSLVTLGSAPAVSYLEFTGVISEQHPYWEDISPSQFATNYNHGGSWMYLEVLEMGYGYDYCYMNGMNLPKVSTYNVTDGSGTVVGSINYYDASGLQSGQASLFLYLPC